MKMEYSFPHYLLSKQSVDDRALNKDVLSALKANLPAETANDHRSRRRDRDDAGTLVALEYRRKSKLHTGR